MLSDQQEHQDITIENNVNDTPPQDQQLRKQLFDEPQESKRWQCTCSNAMPPIEMMENLKSQPSFLINGKWSPLAYIFLIAFICGMAFGLKYAMDTYPSYVDKTNPSFGDFIWRFVIFIYGVCILLYVIKKEGLWPLWSFTMMSWQLFTLRYLFSSLYHLGADSQQVPVFFAMSETLRFPSLVCNTITVSIWWVVLTPLICAVYWWQGHGMKRVKAFLKYNVSPMFINIHFLNLPFAALDHVLFIRELTLFDLWIGMLVAMAYVLVYLFVMDPKGLYFYHVLLSPRPHWCVTAYAFLICLFVGYWYMWNAL